MVTNIQWDHGFSQDSNAIIGSVWAYPKFVSPFDLYPFEIYRSVDILQVIPLESDKYHWKGNNIFWAFLKPSPIKLYPLGAIIWSPANHVADQIINILSNDYRITQVIQFHVPNQRLLKFVNKVYLDDRRCDRTQLSGKCRHMYNAPSTFRFVKFLVRSARLDGNRVSQTSVDLKYRIRKKFKRYIRNYVHDIIIHVSDNASHTRHMEQYVREASQLNKSLPKPSIISSTSDITHSKKIIPPM